MNVNFENRAFKVNKPHVVHETIEGETIVMNLKSGFYYSFDGIGPVVWELILQDVGQKQITEILVKAFPDASINLVDEVDLFVEKLVANEMVTIFHANAAYLPEEEMPGFMSAKDFKKISLKPPLFNIYADMRDVLLLDPIHDVDEKGWPEPKNRSW